MTRAIRVGALAVSAGVWLGVSLCAPSAAADNASDPSTLGRCSAGAMVTWGVAQPVDDATSSPPITRARELLVRSKMLDEAASADERTAADLTTKLVSLRIAAKSARERAARATGVDKETLGARAEDLETDIAVSEAEIILTRKAAADNRRVSRELRLHALKLVREAPAYEDPVALACSPPFRLTADGRKIYRIECLR